MKRQGFTLVEMLVAVALVVLMMTLFTTVFSLATGALGKQKALAEGDQRVRLVLNLLRNDLKNRTMQEVAPWDQNEHITSLAPNVAGRQGYFYYGENDPDDDSDDILQFTASVDPNEDQFYGAAKAILPDGLGSYGPSNTPVPNPLAPPSGPGVTYWQNQPEFDDQLVNIPNGAGASPMAEIAWFLRNGTLYRRVMLIRQPLSGTDPTPNNYPLPLAPLTFIPYTAAGNRNFWTDFDYSAFWQGSLVFHGNSDLANNSGATPLGVPNFRFGHSIATGLPREFVSDGGATPLWYCIGRFTHEETSYMDPAGFPYRTFGYPARIDPLALDPMDNPALTYNAAAGRVAQYPLGSRLGEDVVMTNVLRFDVKVFDETATLGPDGAPGMAGVDDDLNLTVDDVSERGWPGSDDGDFFDLGHGQDVAGQLGSYSARALSTDPSIRAAVTGYCQPHPNGSGKRAYRFDTWNPTVNLAAPFTPVVPYNPPPFRAPDITVGGVLTRRPLRAIQIKITFYDTTSETTRDVTLVQSLTP